VSLKEKQKKNNSCSNNSGRPKSSP